PTNPLNPLGHPSPADGPLLFSLNRRLPGFTGNEDNPSPPMKRARFLVSCREAGPPFYTLGSTRRAPVFQFLLDRRVVARLHAERRPAAREVAQLAGLPEQPRQRHVRRPHAAALVKCRSVGHSRPTLPQTRNHGAFVRRKACYAKF